MADVIITVSEIPETGMCTVFEALQLESLTCEESLKKTIIRPGESRARRIKGNPDITPPLATAYLIEEDKELKPCSYYRHKFECADHYNNHPLDLNDWLKYMAIKKSAGQKVVSKITSQQKRLAAQAEAQQRQGLNLENEGMEAQRRPKQQMIPVKRKPQKLEPMKLPKNK